MSTKKSEPPSGDWDYYQKRFRKLFEDFTRDVLVDQADHYMNMVGFTPVSYDPLPEDPHEDWAVRRQRKWESELGQFSGELVTLREDHP